MHNQDVRLSEEMFEFSEDQISLIEASQYLFEAMKISRISECKIPALDGVTYRRDCFGKCNFYNSRNNQPLTYNEIVSKAPVSRITTSMRSQEQKLLARLNSKSADTNN